MDGGDRPYYGKSKIFLSTDGEAWKIRDFPHFTTICGLRSDCYLYALRANLSCLKATRPTTRYFDILCCLRRALMRRNFARRGKPSERA